MIYKRNIMCEFIWNEDEYKEMKQYAVDRVGIDYFMAFQTIFETAFYDATTQTYHLIVNKSQYKLIMKLYRMGC